MSDQPTVFVVDDDEAVRQSLRRLMESVSLRVETYPSAAEFLGQYNADRPGCLVLDVRMPGMTGLELQQELVRRRLRIPVIIISAHSDVENVVGAIKSGAVDYIKKPYKGKVLLARIREALELDTQQRRAEAERAERAARFSRLSTREREVMHLLVTGKPSKQIALELGLSSKTVDIHRGHILAKLGLESVVELVHLLKAHGTDTPPSTALP